MSWPNDLDDSPRRDDLSQAFGLGLAALVVGAAIGALTALFLSPKSGPELRAQVADAAGNWKEHAAEALAQGRERVISNVEAAQAAPTETGSLRERL